MFSRIVTFLSGALVLISLPLSAAEPQPGTQRGETLKRSVSVELDYLLYLPEKYQEKDAWPVLVFLHGSGERGHDLELVKKHGPPKKIAAGHNDPFIVVSPQCPKYQRWQPVVLDALLDDLIQNLKVDKRRIYLTGLSMGGQGTWDWAAYSPDRFAALVPICGRADRSAAELLAKKPIWVFHGAKDEAVPVSQSEKMVKELKKHGSNVKFTVYPKAGHDSWTETYNNPALYEWLLEQKLP